MKFFLNIKSDSTQTKRVIKRFLWVPTFISQINQTKEYRWFEWMYWEQERSKCTGYWSDWSDYKRIDKNEYKKLK